MFTIQTEGKNLCSFPAQLEEDTSSLVLGQPREISHLIGSLLGPVDLARAMGVSKAWYRDFGRESLWLPHLPPPFLSHVPLTRPAKVEVVFQMKLKECWMRGEIDCVPVNISNPHGTTKIRGGVIAPDGSWILTFGGGQIAVWEGLGTERVAQARIVAGLNTRHDLHNGYDICGGMLSSDGIHTFTFGANGYIVRWKGFGSRQISGELIGGAGTLMNPHLSHQIRGGKMSQDGKWALTFGARGRLVYWSGLEGTSPVGIPIAGNGMSSDPHNSEEIKGCSISPDGSWAVTVSNVIVCWRGFQTGSISGSAWPKEVVRNVSPSDCLISIDGLSLFTVGMGGMTKWTGVGEEEFSTRKLLGGVNQVVNLRLSPTFLNIIPSLDGTWVLTIGRQTLVLWNSLEGNETIYKTLPDPRSDKFINVALLSPDSAWAVVIGYLGIAVHLPKVQLRMNSRECPSPVQSVDIQ